ncbi:DMT family transporter [Galbitalea soli]|uniref:DMT family transporter n=1 Tax=Galbitalea soli TaxID=1268042 RepID=A0A7C9PPJ0_9MICO|nr:DMT family transporter [Galbitalea soli]NEM92372.1 DMT family transporter [Galbitalea soli]NYJ31671.1 transporter family-2 protein [Galbitalea soli]
MPPHSDPAPGSGRGGEPEPIIQPGTPPHPHHSTAAFVTAVLFTVVCGGLVSLQSRINGQLGHEIGDGFIAAVLSFGSGLVLLAIIVALSPRGRRGLGTIIRALRTRELTWWYVCGGVAGALFVLSQGLTAAILGVALFTVAVVAGQTLSGLAIDARGLGRIPAKVVTPPRLIGAVLALVAVAIAVAPEFRGQVPAWMLVMPFAVGLLLGWQQAVNGQVKTLSNSALTATFINFLGGSVALVILAVVHTAIAGWPAHLAPEPYLYVGGVIGMIFIAGFAFATPIIGVLLQSLCAIAGQLLMSLLLDVVAPADRGGLAWTTVLGTALTLVAVVIATVRPRRYPSTLRNSPGSRGSRGVDLTSSRTPPT